MAELQATESRRGKPGRDLTGGPIFQTLTLFAAPTLASNVLQSLNGSINSIWVGQLLGDAALAATANANIVMFLVFATVFGFGMAATVKVGQHFGARDIDAARRTFGTALGFCGVLSMIVAVLGWLLAPQMLTALSTPGGAFPLALSYLRVIFISMPAGMISIMLAMGLRGSGDARSPLLFMILTVALDVVLNPLLIAGIGPFPQLGIAGSATATLIANFIGLAANLAYIYVRDLPLRLRGRELCYLIPARSELAYIVGKGLPMGAQMLIISGAGIIMVGIVNREGLIATAAYGASLQLWNYLQMPAMAIGAAVSAMAAQAIGASLHDRLHKITRAGIMLNVVMTGILTVLLLLFDRPALVLFLGADSPAVPLARHIQFLVSWTFILFGVTIVLFGTMRAAGAVYAPLITLAISMYPVRLGFYGATRAHLGMDAIWWAFAAGSLVSMGLAIAFYRQRGWLRHAHARPTEEAAELCETDGEPAGRISPAM